MVSKQHIQRKQTTELRSPECFADSDNEMARAKMYQIQEIIYFMSNLWSLTALALSDFYTKP